MKILGLLLCLAALCRGGVDHIWLEERTDVQRGRAFGSAGPYERIKARAYFTVDPTAPANRIVRDLELAPRNADGLVEFSADLIVVRPRDPAKTNGTMLVDILNRGTETLWTFDFGRYGADPQTQADSFLLEQGFALAWIGWQFDVPDQPGRMRVYVPSAGGVKGTVRGEFVPDRRTTVMPLAEREHRPYPALPEGARLTVRDTPVAAPRPLPQSAWRFRDPGHIEMAAGFQPGRIYELVYQSENPAIVGLGMAAVRDLVSFFKYENSPMLLGDQRRGTKRVIGFGTSQSGRFLRHFLYDGFNADEKGRKVFDGVWAHVAGAGRGSFNHRFAQPSRDGQPWANYLWPTDLFPFTDTVETDPVTGATGSLLATAEKQNVVPKIFHTNGSYEYWGRAASLITTTADGTRDAPLAPGSRVYFFAGAQHGAGRLPPVKEQTQNWSNTNDYRFAMRALLLGFHHWLKDGTEPPLSTYPRLDAGQLVPRLKGPAPRIAYRLDFSAEPPRLGKPYTVLLPAVGPDGNETAGIRMPWVQAPLGVYTGWNLRTPETGAPQAMVAFVGSFFPWSKAEITKRYASREAYLDRIRAAAAQLVADRYALEQDVPAMIERAQKEWDHWTN